MKWYLDEVRAAEAEGLLASGHEMHVPDFFYQEVATAFWKLTRRGALDPVHVTPWLRDLSRIQLAVHRSQEIAVLAWDVAAATPIAIYDAAYLAIARREECFVVTADRKFFSEARSAGHAAFVRRLEDTSDGQVH